MIPFINPPFTTLSTDIFPSESCDINISNSTSTVSLTSISASDTTEKFIIPSRYMDVVGGAGATLELVISHKNNEGAARAPTMNVLVNGVVAIPASGTSVASTLPSGTFTRSCLLRVTARRAGATTGFVSVEWNVGGGAAFTNGTFTRSHNAAATFPAIGTPVTLSVTAAMAVASNELTMSVDRRRVWVF